jgi:hypothetical protein
MGFTTDSISYNVRERGRKARGADRNFDTVALAKLINGPSVQEQVKHGDMLGYFGHWPRIKFGMQCVEGGIVDGASVTLPIAIRTVELRADNDGTISHRTEFLDTEAGLAAGALFKSKAGGFSSAIEPVRGTSPMVAQGFYGFDYVYEPNFTANRGHKIVLDSIGLDASAMLDAVLAQAAQAEGEMAMLFDSLHAQHLTVIEAMDRIAADNEWLINRLSMKTGIAHDVLLDAIGSDDADFSGRMRGTVAPPDYEKFKTARLEGLSGADSRVLVKSAESEYARLRFGVRL